MLPPPGLLGNGPRVISVLERKRVRGYLADPPSTLLVENPLPGLFIRALFTASWAPVKAKLHVPGLPPIGRAL